MSTASTTSPAIVRSSSRQQPSYSVPADDRPRRTASTTTKPSTIPNSVPRSNSQSRSQARPTSSSQQPALSGVPRREYETINVARPPSSSRRSSSRERSYIASVPKRTESTRETRHTSRPSHSRNNSRMSTAGTAVANGASASQAASGARVHADATPHGNTGSARRRTTIIAQTGEWALGKTIGAGSMGKVKLAKNLETGEQV